MENNQKQSTGANAFIVDNMLSCAAYWSCSGALIAKLTQYYGFSLSVSNILLSFQGMLLVLQLFGGYAYSRSDNRHSFLKKYNLVWRFFLPLVLLSTILPKQIGGAVMIASLFIMVATFQFVSPGQNAWLISCVEGKVKSNYYSMRDLYFMLLFTAMNFVFGIMVDETAAVEKPALGFAMIGIVVAAVLAISLYFLIKKLPAPGAARKKEKGTFWSSVLLPLHDSRFKKVLCFNAMWNLANAFIGSFAALYQIRVLNLDYVYVVFWATIGNAARVISIPLFARLAQRIGWKKVVMLCMGITLSTGVMWMLTTKETCAIMFPLVTILGPVANGGLGVGMFKFQVVNSPADETSIYFSTNAALAGVSSMLGTAMCSAIVEVLSRQSASPAYWIVFAIGIAGVMLTIYLVHISPFAGDKQ
ncbi:MAG: MFS transporter [Oscillospiraceae bacterium]